MKSAKISFVLSAFILVLIACEGNKNYVPKPPTYLEINLPERTYENYKDTCNFHFQKPAYFQITAPHANTCNRDVVFKGLNGTLHLSVIQMDTSLATYVNYAIDKVNEHKIKATAILDTNIIRQEERVFGTFFELQGNVASPFQFYVTDSTDRFISGVVYFNARPNYDSILPALNFVKKDLLNLMNTIDW
ncbi:MAG: hypothetical protein R3277_06700 [Brumimicrobium sp.]|nr:hypothetical protein [Brumimicrobium sp.]